jgi:transcription elongation factor GreA
MRRYKSLPINMPKEVVDPIPVTTAFYTKTNKKYDALQKERIEVMARLKTAREMGDLSENGAYKYAKFELGSIGRQLRELAVILKNGYIEEQLKGDHISFGSEITLLDVARGASVTYVLLSDYEANPSLGSISIKSPLGQQLMGKKVGESIVLVMPRQSVEYQITKVA